MFLKLMAKQKFGLVFFLLLSLVSEQLRAGVAATGKYYSPDGTHYLKHVIWTHGSPYPGQESSVTVFDSKGNKIGRKKFYSDEDDGQHGYRVLEIQWSPDSKFVVFSTVSSGGHSAWHCPTFVFSIGKRKFISIDDSVGPVGGPKIGFRPPDILMFSLYNFKDGSLTTKKVSLSNIIKESFRLKHGN